MAHQDIEIEIKYPLFNPEDVRAFLNTHGTMMSQDVLQKDTYYVPSHRNFLRVKYPFEFLRTRESAKGSSINYKHFYPENVKVTDYCDEFESKVENVEAVKKIFQSLDITEAVVVEKVRTTWMFEDVEIVIDEVKELGSYIELEATTHFNNPQDGRALLYKTLEKLKAKVGEEDLRGYPFRILEKKGYVFGE